MVNKLVTAAELPKLVLKEVLHPFDCVMFNTVFPRVVTVVANYFAWGYYRKGDYDSKGSHNIIMYLIEY